MLNLDYYTVLILMVFVFLIAQSILVYENNRIRKENKKHIYLSYLLIGLSALAEMVGLKLNGNPGIPAWSLVMVKTADYICTPLAGGAVIAQLRIKNVWSNILYGVLGFNIVFQTISAFTGWMLTIDETNHYSHGPLYIVYVICYLIILVVVIIQFVVYGRKFSKHNRGSLYAILFLIIAGIAVQEILGGDYRTSYIALAMGVCLLFTHYTEYSQILSDDKLREQRALITTDILTGIGSRFAYEHKLQTYERDKNIPEDLALFLMDINGLKKINDTYGHEAGDELICAAAECIVGVFGHEDVYRIGGDEFVAMARMQRKEAEEALLRIAENAGKWTGKNGNTLNIAAGFALVSENRELSCEQLAKAADEEMYQAKEKYYHDHGIEKRGFS